jgi:hypothetical protein
MTGEEKIRQAFENKNWHEIKVTDSWQIFKIMAEFVDGFEKLAKIGPCVSIFGSARTHNDNPYYGVMALFPAAALVLWRPRTKVPTRPVVNRSG